MSNNETRISNERLAEMLAGLEDATPGPWNRRRVGHQWAVEDRHTRYIAMMQNSVDERQGNAAHIARCAPDTIRAMILELQALRSTPVETDHIADAGKMVEAHPLPNPSPSDGEVSEAEVNNALSAMWKAQGLGWTPHAAMRSALKVSKRGQP